MFSRPIGVNGQTCANSHAFFFFGGSSNVANLASSSASKRNSICRLVSSISLANFSREWAILRRAIILSMTLILSHNDGAPAAGDNQVTVLWREKLRCSRCGAARRKKTGELPLDFYPFVAPPRYALRNGN